MLLQRKQLILCNYVTACTYDFILKKIEKKTDKLTLLICPIASQTLVRAYFDQNIRKVLNRFDYIVPCSEWVHRTINFLYNLKLRKRVYGPDLMLKVCKLAEEHKYNIFLYGTTKKTVKRLKTEIKKAFPKINIVGTQPSKFSPLTKVEKKTLITKIETNKTQILFIGLGSPLQEIFTYELLQKKPSLKKPLTIITVGASFDFISGMKAQAPKSLQNIGLEWLFRLSQEPRRLWSRYLIYGSLFIFLVIAQKVSLLLNRGNNIIGKREA